MIIVTGYFGFVEVCSYGGYNGLFKVDEDLGWAEMDAFLSCYALDSHKHAHVCFGPAIRKQAKECRTIHAALAYVKRIELVVNRGTGFERPIHQQC